MTSTRLRPQDDARIVEHGYGLTDLVGRWDPPRVDVDALVAKVAVWQPEWLAFTSKGAAHRASKALGRRGRPGLGAADWFLDRTQVFVDSGASDAGNGNAGFTNTEIRSFVLLGVEYNAVQDEGGVPNYETTAPVSQP